MKRGLATVVSGGVVSAILAGCSSSSYSPLHPTETPPATPVPRASTAEIVPVRREPPPVTGLDHVETGRISVPEPTRPPPETSASFGTGWIPLREWARRCAGSAPERSASGGAITYRITTQGGVCKLTIGSRLAQWNGISLWLGFAPQLVQGEPRIHALDAEKNLLPLASLAAAPPTRTRTVVLDPGHGGSDGGTQGSRKEMEKIYALDWALRTERLLTNSGWKVFLTRRTDVDVSLAERVAFADRVQADLFVSLHFNSTSPQTQPSGIETYCLTPVGMPSTLARGYTDDPRAVFPNNAFDRANLEWAFHIHRAMLAQTRAHDDGLKRARFMSVLRYQNRPAVLVEGGFVSNPGDMASIASPNYRERLASAVAEALK